MTIYGQCDPRFEAVRDAFAEGFEKRGDQGAAVAVTVDGELVVDLWGGFADKAQTQPWGRDTLINLGSTTKGFLAVCALRLIDQGLLELDAPVARYWPEFAHADKGAIPVRDLLSHRAGLPALRAQLPPEALFDWTRMTDALAAEAPWWPPGTEHGYHAMTIGWLLGELVRRQSGKSIGRYFRDEVAAPLEVDLHIGLGPDELARTADVRTTRPDPSAPSFVQTVMREPDSLTGRAFLNPQLVLAPSMLNSAAWRAAELPFANGHGTARGIARLYGTLAVGGTAGGTRVLSPETIARARVEEAYGRDAVLRETTRYGLGFMLSHPGAPFGPGTTAFGNPGAGGFLGFADPDARVGFGYVTSKMGLHVLVDPRATALVDAVYAVLGGT